MTDYKIFIVSALLLIGLIAGSTALQNKAATQTTPLPDTAATITTSQSVAPTITDTPATPSGVKPQIQGFGGERGDD